MHRMLLCIAVLVTACRSGSTPALTQSTTATALAINATMVSVVDGDTIDVNIKGHRERVRLIGIDTPETKKPNTPVQCYGPEATKFTKSLLPAGHAAASRTRRRCPRRLRIPVQRRVGGQQRLGELSRASGP